VDTPAKLCFGTGFGILTDKQASKAAAGTRQSFADRCAAQSRKAFFPAQGRAGGRTPRPAQGRARYWKTLLPGLGQAPHGAWTSPGP
jgi:hypothetical protein